MGGVTCRAPWTGVSLRDPLAQGPAQIAATLRPCFSCWRFILVNIDNPIKVAPSRKLLGNNLQRGGRRPPVLTQQTEKREPEDNGWEVLALIYWERQVKKLLAPASVVLTGFRQSVWCVWVPSFSLVAALMCLPYVTEIITQLG